MGNDFNSIMQLANLPSALKQSETMGTVVSKVGDQIVTTMGIGASEAKAKEIESWARTFESVNGKKHTTMAELKKFKQECESF